MRQVKMTRDPRGLLAMTMAMAPLLASAQPDQRPEVVVASVGEAQRRCSPTDGPSLQVSFDASDGRRLVLWLNAEPGRAWGTWPTGRPDEAGGLSAALCRDDGTDCLALRDSWITVAVDGSIFKGRWRVRTPQGHLIEQYFTASVPSEPRPKCG